MPDDDIQTDEIEQLPTDDDMGEDHDDRDAELQHEENPDKVEEEEAKEAEE